MIRHNGPISGVATHNGGYAATAGYDNQVILWDTERGESRGRAFHDHLANQVVFSPDGAHLLSSSSDYTARLWSVPELRLEAVFADHGDDVEMAAFHPSAPLLATACRDHLVRVFDFSGRLVARMQGHTADVISVAWLDGGEQLLSSSDDGTIKRWDALTGALLDDLDLGGIETDTIAIAADGTVYAGNDEGAIIRIREDGTTAIPAHAAGIKRLVYQAATDRLVSLSYDRTLRIWDTSGDPVCVHSTEFPAQIWARSCAFLNDSILVFATFGSAYATYDLADGTWNLDLVQPTDCVNAVTVAPDGRTYTVGDAGIVAVDERPTADVGSLCNFLVAAGGRMLTGGQLGRVLDADTGELVHQHRSPLNCGVAFERDGVPHVLIGAYTGEGLVFAVDRDRGVRHVATLPLAGNAIKGVAVSDGILFAVSADTSASWFSVETLTELRRLEDAHTRIANGCAGLPGGRFASISRDLKLRIWEGGSAETVPTPHDHSIKCVSARPDGALIATGSYSGSVALYDPRTGQWPLVTRPTTSGISSLCYDPVGDSFLASSYDGNVYRVPATAREDR
jgi:toxoflavin biosynthesis protein ToxC